MRLIRNAHPKGINLNSPGCNPGLMNICVNVCNPERVEQHGWCVQPFQGCIKLIVLIIVPRVLPGAIQIQALLGLCSIAFFSFRYTGINNNVDTECLSRRDNI